MTVKKSALLARLRGRVSEEEWSSLSRGGLRVSDFNRGALLEMKSIALKEDAEVDPARVDGLRGALIDYLRRFLPEAPEAWKWIVLACLYLAFIAERPMHPIDLLHIRSRAEDGRTVYECPHRSDDPTAACRYCVCRRG